MVCQDPSIIYRSTIHWKFYIVCFKAKRITMMFILFFCLHSHQNHF
nr:MAG TPA: hypothetical protein [Caudoviricetes sp.]